MIIDKLQNRLIVDNTCILQKLLNETINIVMITDQSITVHQKMLLAVLVLKEIAERSVLAMMLVVCCVVQRDLDFTIDLDFHGELTELVDTMQYKMRQPVTCSVIQCHCMSATDMSLLSLIRLLSDKQRFTCKALIYRVCMSHTFITGLEVMQKLYFSSECAYVQVPLIICTVLSCCKTAVLLCLCS